MVQPAVVADGDGAAAVDLVGADSVVRSDDRSARDRFGTGGVALGWGSSVQGPVGSAGVVVPAEPVQLALQLGQGGCGWLGREPLLLGLVEALHFSAGLWVGAAGVAEPDTEQAELDLQGDAALAACIAVKMAALSVSTEAGFPCLPKALRKLRTTSPAVVVR